MYLVVVIIENRLNAFLEAVKEMYFPLLPLEMYLLLSFTTSSN